MKQFTVTELPDGRITLTAKNGFAIRVSVAHTMTPGVHIFGETPGVQVEASLMGPKGGDVTRTTKLVSLYAIEKA